MTEATTFADLSRIGIERFLQTVLVIDNDLTVDTPSKLPDLALKTPSGGLRASPPPASPTTSPEPPFSPDPAAAEEADTHFSPLDAKQIMDAFLKRSLICGLHKPTKGNALVDEAILAARRSDTVIIDWLLDGSDTRSAKEIIARIVEGDAAEQGRLRLIAVYTSEPDVRDIAEQIAHHLKSFTFKTPELGVLVGPDTRIVVLNKEGSVGASREVTVADLPGRIIDEFALLTSGVLGTFAVTAIAAVRRATHHVLTIFSEGLDGAYIGHMCALEAPEDALEFALDLLAGELRNVISMDTATVSVLAAESIALRIDALAVDGKLAMGEVEIPLEVARAFPDRGSDGVLKSRDKQQKPGKQSVSKAEAVTVENVGHLFHRGAASPQAAHARFARLTTFKTEIYDRTILPATWAPTLSLGTLVVARLHDGQVDETGFLLCTQPRCDAVRLKVERRFPFQTASAVAADKPFDLVIAVPGPPGCEPLSVYLKVGTQPYEGITLAFAPNHDKRVKAVKDEAGHFEFRSTEDKRYLWVGDLRDLTAQRSASAVAARMHGVGLDEFEWLRLASRRQTSK